LNITWRTQHQDYPLINQCLKNDHDEMLHMIAEFNGAISILLDPNISIKHMYDDELIEALEPNDQIQQYHQSMMKFKYII